MKCSHCGAENKENSKFCSKCGGKLSKVTVVNNVSASDSISNDNKAKIIIAVTVIVVVAIALFTCYSLGVFGVQSYDSSTGVGQTSEVTQVSLSAFPVSEAPNLAQQISKTGNADSVKFKGVTLTKSQVLYILTKSISMIASGNAHGTINVGSYSYAGHPSGANVAQSISSSQYVDMCNRFSSWIERNNQVPNYVGINVGGVPDISPSKMLNICVNILLQYKNTGSLPASVAV